MARVLRLKLNGPGRLSGRVMGEALAKPSATPVARKVRVASDPAANGFRTVLSEQVLGTVSYFDEAAPTGVR